MARTIDKTGLMNRMLRRLSNRGFNSLSTGSMVRTMAEIWAEETSQVLEDIDFITSRYMLANATGGFLDILGQLVGLQRTPPITSSVDAEDEIVKFYTTTGVLSDYLPASDVSGFAEIPAGTRISDPDNVVVYEVERTIVPMGVSEIYVGASAVETGSHTTVPANNLTNHDLNISNISVTNTSAISNGADLESDENFRYRISRSRTTAAKANETAVRLAALLVPGISDVNLKPNVYGPGTFEVLLVPEGNVVTESQRTTAEISIRDAASFGTTIYITEPTYLTINMVVHVTTQNMSTQNDNSTSQETALGNVLSYLSSIPIGGSFNPAVLERRLLDGDPNLINAEVILLCIDGKPVPSSIYQLDDNELFMPDPQLSNPIQVLI